MKSMPDAVMHAISFLKSGVICQRLKPTKSAIHVCLQAKMWRMFCLLIALSQQACVMLPLLMTRGHWKRRWLLWGYQNPLRLLH